MSARKIVMKIVSISFSVLVVVLVIFVLFKAGTFAYDFGYRIYTEEPVSKEPGQDVVVEIEEGMSATSIGKLLEDKNLIRDDKLFAVQMKISSYAKTIRPGIYTLNTSMTSEEMMQIMSAVDETKQEDTEKKTEASTEEVQSTEEVPQTEVSE